MSGRAWAAVTADDRRLAVSSIPTRRAGGPLKATVARLEAAGAICLSDPPASSQSRSAGIGKAGPAPAALTVGAGRRSRTR